jgi:hypothetical protein
VHSQHSSCQAACHTSHIAPRIARSRRTTWASWCTTNYFGLGYRQNPSLRPTYGPVIFHTARSLAEQVNPKVGCTESWSPGPHCNAQSAHKGDVCPFTVIIDNNHGEPGDTNIRCVERLGRGLRRLHCRRQSPPPDGGQHAVMHSDCRKKPSALRRLDPSHRQTATTQTATTQTRPAPKTSLQ